MKPLLEIRNLSKSFGGLLATNDASFSLMPGELHALIGPNGAGKTTLVHQISGALKPDSGTIIFEGSDIGHLSMDERVAAGLARSYQIVSLFPDFSARDNVALAVQARRGSSMRFWKRVAAEQDINDEALEILKAMGLGHCANVRAADLGHGEQRQLELGLAVATKPRMLLLDEPLAGMGGDESEMVIKHILTLKKTMTILLVEHDMAAVFRLADTISCLVQGSVVASGTPDHIRSHPAVKAAYLGDEVTT